LGNKWQIGPVKLANGEDAWIDAINEGQEQYRYTGRVMGQNGFIPVGWHTNGSLMFATTDHPRNLAPPPKKKVRIQTLLVVYGNGKTCGGYSDRERAVIEAKRRGFALIEIDREVEEGEGL
jgi:hypothetical protein